MNANWNYPTAMRVGPGRLSELPDVCQEAGISAPLLVTDPGLATLPMVENAIISCRDAGQPVSYTHLTLPTKRIV